MCRQDQEVLWIYEGVLRGALQEKLRVLCQELIKGSSAGDQQLQRRLAAAPRTAQALPGTGDGAGVPDQNGGVKASNVDSQLKSAGRHDAAHLASA